MKGSSLAESLQHSYISTHNQHSHNAPVDVRCLIAASCQSSWDIWLLTFALWLVLTLEALAVD